MIPQLILMELWPEVVIPRVCILGVVNLAGSGCAGLEGWQESRRGAFPSMRESGFGKMVGE